MQAAEGHEGIDATSWRRFLQGRQRGVRELMSAGRGAWFVALDGGLVVGSLGVVVTGARARYQTVDTVASHRRRGIASRLVVEAAHRIAASHPVSQFVISADPEYHALWLYESLGFTAVECVVSALKRPAN